MFTCPFTKFLLLGVLLASPSVAVLVLRNDPGPSPDIALASNQTDQATQLVNPVQFATSEAATAGFPVEVVAEGANPQWIYLKIQGESVPEPGIFSLLAAGTLLLFLRRR